MVHGDWGAFAYVDRKTSAYPPQKVVEFYSDVDFTHWRVSRPYPQ